MQSNYFNSNRDVAVEAVKVVRNKFWQTITAENKTIVSGICGPAQTDI